MFSVCPYFFTNFNLVVLLKFALIKNKSLSYSILAKGAGRKDEQKRRGRVYSHNTTNEPPVQSPFSEILHNSHPISDLLRIKCCYCGKVFPRGPLTNRRKCGNIRIEIEHQN